MRKTAGVLVIILGAVSAFYLTGSLALGGDSALSWLWFGVLWIPAIVCSVFVFKAKFWMASIILAVLFGGIIPAILIYSAKKDWEKGKTPAAAQTPAK